MYNWKRKIDCLEYDSNVFTHLSTKDDVRNETEIKKSVIEITRFRLACSVAKSILTKGHKYSPEVSAFARLYFHSTSFFVR